MTQIYNNEKFSGVSSVGDHLLMSQIENNIKTFLDWGFLHIGGFINVYRSQSNIYGNPASKVKPTEDPNYQSGQVWQTMRKDWVWESGVSYTRDSDVVSPININGIYINDTFYPVHQNHGAYNYKIDYSNSRIIFDNPVPLNLNIEMEYSYRWLQIYNYDTAKWWQQLQYKTDANSAHFNQTSQGDFSILSTNRVQLPAIIIESISRGLSKPYELGNKSLVMKQELMLHIVAETMADRNMVIDILRLQQDKVIKMYDTNTIIKNKTYPFGIDGTLNPQRLQYDQLINNNDYLWSKVRLMDIFASDVESFNPFFTESNLKLTVEVIFDINN